MANNPILFNAALSGAFSGINTSRSIKSAASGDYATQRNSALTFATLLDDEIPAGSYNQQDGDLLGSIVQQVVSGKGESAPNLTLITAIIAAFTAAQAVLVTAPTPGGSCTLVNGFTVAAINTALASGADEVCFPPGVYVIDGAVIGNEDEQTIMFQPGAVLEIAPATGSIVFSGARQKINGLAVIITTASAVAFTAVRISGDGSIIQGAQFNVNDDVDNATLLKLSGDRIHASDLKIIGLGKAFKYGIHAIATDDIAQVDSITIDGIDVDVGDDGVNATFGALIYWRGIRGEIRDLSFDGGGRALFPDGVVIIDGNSNILLRPKIFASAATYGIYRKDLSEFLDVYSGRIQGRNNGTYQAGSEGIFCGDLAGQLKLIDTTITGWVNGVVIHGSHDAPTFVGTTIVNNEQYCLVVDFLGVGGVRGITFIGCYLFDVLGVGLAHFVNGLTEGMHITGCEIGYEDIGILVEDSYGTFEGIVLTGNFIQGGATPIAVIQPGINSSTILFINNKLQSAGTFGTGLYAAMAMDIYSPTFVAMITGTARANTSMQIGSLGDAFLQENFTYFTANFAAGIGALAAVELDFAWSEAIINRMFTWGLTGPAAADTSLLFFAYVKVAGTLTLRGYNFTAVPVGAISGTIFVRSTKIVL